MQTLSGTSTANFAEKKVNAIFGTPMLSMVCPDVDGLNRELASLILDAEQKNNSVEQSNMGGWQSEKTLQTWGKPAISGLMALIDVGVYLLMSETIGEEKVDALEKKWKVAAWANVNRKSNFNGIHYHIGGFWSGVYYVAAELPEDAKEDGLILFRNPTLSSIIANTVPAPPALRDLFKAQLAIRPAAGLMLIFPSWLEHWVTPHSSINPRISVAFDVMY
jgi:uncharacterized protein (TIGR02466 family)